MGRLIDEQTAYNVLTDYYHHTLGIQHAALKEALGRVETVDAIQVVHGRWTIEDFRVAPHRYCCSNCTAYHRARYAYCPSCGAVMDGKDGDTDGV